MSVVSSRLTQLCVAERRRCSALSPCPARFGSAPGRQHPGGAGGSAALQPAGKPGDPGQERGDAGGAAGNQPGGAGQESHHEGWSRGGWTDQLTDVD